MGFLRFFMKIENAGISAKAFETDFSFCMPFQTDVAHMKLSRDLDNSAVD